MDNGTRNRHVDELLAAWIARDTGHALVFCDLDGRIVGWTPGAQDLLGYDAADAIGAHLSMLFMPQDRLNRQAETELEVARRLGQSEDDRWHLRADGAAVWVSGMLSAIVGRQGDPLGFVKVMRDRTDVRTQLETLESRVAGLQHQLESATLLLSTVGHEIRNPLAPLSNAMTLIERGAAVRGDPNVAVNVATADSATDERRLPLSIVRRQIAVLERLAADLMDFSRLGAGKLELRWSTFMLQDLVLEIVDAHAEQARRLEVRLEALLSPPPLPLTADRERLQQVLVNVLDNALKHSKSGGMISMRVVDEPPEAVVRIEDDGAGIAPELLPRIFELFTQGPRATGAPPGIGIGLALAKDLVELHGGSIDARSAGLGKGAEFTVRLPRRQRS